uniref:Putative lipoprotein n=1 Tax=Dechloromonas aromatica (strain RCB) TaxID=159087 RepID=Q47E13_DECAR
MLLSGCAQVSALQMAGTAVGMVLEATGVTKKDNGDQSKITKDLPIRIFAGDQLNLTSNSKPLSLVIKIYVLRSSERLKTLTYPQITSTESEKEALGDELISVREIILLPGKSYDAVLKIPGDATTIGVVGMFRAPYSSRWKLAFDSKQSFDSGITIGAHACALSASKGALVTEISPESVRSLVGIQCNS